MNHLGTYLIAVLATASSAAALGQVTVHSGAPGSPGPVQAFDEVTGALVAAPAELAAVELLPIECSGCTALEEFLPGKARRRDDIEGASRLALPDLQGSLYHYVRDGDLARVFGYFVVTRNGSPRVLLEQAGVGVAGDQDPFLDRVAVARDGRTFLCATKTAAGGNLLEVNLAADPALVVDRTAGAPPVRIGARGLVLTDTHVWATTGRGVVRGLRAGNGNVQIVNYGGQPAPTYFQGDLVTSEHGTAVAFHAGASATVLHTWTATNTGPAQRASSETGAYTDAGFLPQAVDGPYLAVSDDGAWCAWRKAITTPLGPARDCVVARSAAPAGEVQEVLTSDMRFTDTLDEVAVFVFRGPTQVIIAVGEQGGPGQGIEGIDLFRAELTPGGASTISNVTGSSGDFTEPFLGIPTLKPTRWTMSPDRRSLLLHDDAGSDGPVLVVDLATGAVTTILTQIKGFDWVELAGQRFVFGIQRGTGGDRHEVHSIPADLTGASSLSYWSPVDEPTRVTSARVDGEVSWLRAVGLNRVLQRVRVPLANVETWGPAGVFPGAHAWTRLGSLAFEEAGDAWLWPVGASAPTSFTPAGPFQVLPGV